MSFLSDDDEVFAPPPLQSTVKKRFKILKEKSRKYLFERSGLSPGRKAGYFGVVY